MWPPQAHYYCDYMFTLAFGPLSISNAGGFGLPPSLSDGQGCSVSLTQCHPPLTNHLSQQLRAGSDTLTQGLMAANYIIVDNTKKSGNIYCGFLKQYNVLVYHAVLSHSKYILLTHCQRK